MIAKVICTLAMRQRPAMRLCTSRSASSADSRSKRRVSSSPRPIVLPSMIPLTLSDSSISALMSARRPWRTVVMRLRSAPTRRVSHRKNGSSARLKTARRQSSANIATTVASTVVTLETIEVAVDVTTFCTPPMSLAMRDWTSPVRVRVKKASDMRCRWRYTAARRSCITRWPTRFDSHVCPTPRTPVDDRHADHPQHEPGQQRRVVLRDRDVEDLAQQERRGHRQRRRQGDEREDGEQPPPVWPEECGDAPCIGPLHGLILAG